MLAVLTVLGGNSARALESLVLLAPNSTAELRTQLSRASLLAQAVRDGRTAADELVALSRADYARLLEALYAQGHFGPTISIRIDGREAADIPTFEPPERITEIRVTVEPGPVYRFGRAAAGPLAPRTRLPTDFRRGRPATTGLLLETADTAVDAWRNAGHAKAGIGSQDLSVIHPERRLDAAIFIDPGPRLAFGDLSVRGNRTVREDDIRRIVAWPRGRLFAPDELSRAETRLRRTGAFRSVVIEEAEVPNPDGTLPHTLSVVEERPRRFGFGGEFSSVDGLSLSAFWLHRNLFGGAERLRFDARIEGAGGQTGGLDGGASVRLERSATFFSETDLFVDLSFETRTEPDFAATTIENSVGLSRIFSDRLSGDIALAFSNTQAADVVGGGTFRLLSLPVGATWDSRDDPLDATEGVFVDGEVRPFLGFVDAGSGVRMTADARTYVAFGPGDRLVAAGRLQVGSIVGPALASVPSDLRFFSGGGGTVRGQSFQSLGVPVGDALTGGLSFAALSAELRGDIGDRFGLVGFIDAGFVGDTALPGASGSVHAGAGLGFRYNTGLGPIRLDLATPITESDGGKFFFYIGIGEAF